jgi:ABC-2 type transport system ATP-binding protein
MPTYNLATEKEHMTAALAICGVSKRYGALWANRDITLSVPAGAVHGLLGPNGAGKTTLIRICAGWLAPDTGSVWVGGERQSLTSIAARAQLGVVSRDAPLYDELTVAETLFLRATLCGVMPAARRAICAAAIEEYRLAEVAQRRVGVLSTGMQQRVAIACAMLHNPAVLLLDEPTVGLDPDVRRHIWDCLRALTQRGVAVLLTTHYLEEAVRLCGAVHVIARGVIISTIATATLDGSVERLEATYLEAVSEASRP